jgi:hypothetical protein
VDVTSLRKEGREGGWEGREGGRVGGWEGGTLGGFAAGRGARGVRGMIKERGMINPVTRVIAGWGGRCGGGGRPHLMFSVCIDARPARLVERTAAPSGPMPFELRESDGEGAQGSEERTGPGGGGVIMHLSPTCYKQ